MIEKKIAEKIRRIRNSKHLTLSQLAGKTGLSQGLLSRIENNRVSPPIATLSKIAHGLDVPIALFFEEEDSGKASYAVIRRGERQRVVRSGTKIGFHYDLVSGLARGSVIEAYVVHFPVIEKDPKLLFDHPGEEFLFVLKGDMELVYANERIPLRTGDAIHFDSAAPHRGRNAGKEEAECLVIVVGEEFIKGKKRETL